MTQFNIACQPNALILYKKHECHNFWFWPGWDGLLHARLPSHNQKILNLIQWANIKRFWKVKEEGKLDRDHRTFRTMWTWGWWVPRVFFLPFLYPGWDTGEIYNPELPTDTDKKVIPKKSLHPLTEGQRKSNPEVQKTFLIIYTITQQNTKGEIVPALQNQLGLLGNWSSGLISKMGKVRQVNLLLSLTRLVPVVPKAKPKFYPHTAETGGLRWPRVMLVVIMLPSPWYYQWVIEWWTELSSLPDLHFAHKQ